MFNLQMTAATRAAQRNYSSDTSRASTTSSTPANMPTTPHLMPQDRLSNPWASLAVGPPSPGVALDVPLVLGSMIRMANLSRTNSNTSMPTAPGDVSPPQVHAGGVAGLIARSVHEVAAAAEGANDLLLATVGILEFISEPIEGAPPLPERVVADLRSACMAELWKRLLTLPPLAKATMFYSWQQTCVAWCDMPPPAALAARVWLRHMQGRPAPSAAGTVQQCAFLANLLREGTASDAAFLNPPDTAQKLLQEWSAWRAAHTLREDGTASTSARQAHARTLRYIDEQICGA
jgi:hypothetical protein